jgi:hypothetical protein
LPCTDTYWREELQDGGVRSGDEATHRPSAATCICQPSLKVVVVQPQSGCVLPLETEKSTLSAQIAPLVGVKSELLFLSNAFIF